MERRSDGIGDDLLNLHDNVSLQIYFFLRVGLSEVPLQLAVTQLVACLVLPVVLSILLHGVVHQVNELVIQVVHVVFFRTGADVTVSVEICFE